VRFCDCYSGLFLRRVPRHLLTVGDSKHAHTHTHARARASEFYEYFISFKPISHKNIQDHQRGIVIDDSEEGSNAIIVASKIKLAVVTLVRDIELWVVGPATQHASQRRSAVR